MEDQELQLKNIELLQLALLENRNNSNEFIIVPQYDKNGKLIHRQMPNKREAMELGPNDPLFLALTGGAKVGGEALYKAGKTVGKALYKGGVKAVEKVTPYLNYFSPGTTLFMNMWNSGAFGKLLGTIITGGEAAATGAAVDAAIKNPNLENISLAVMSTIPYYSGAKNIISNKYFDLAKDNKLLRDFTLGFTYGYDNALDFINTGINKIGKTANKVKKYFNADRRINNLIKQTVDLRVLNLDLTRKIRELYDDYFSDVYVPAKLENRNIQTERDILQSLNENPSILELEQLGFDFSKYKPLRFFLKNPNYFYSYESNLPSGKYSKVLRTRDYPRKYNLDISKLPEDHLKRLIAARIADIEDPEKLNRLKSNNLFEAYVDELFKKYKLTKNSQGELIFSNGEGITIPVRNLYNPESFINPQYTIYSFRNLNAPALSGNILFSTVDEIPSLVNPSVNLTTQEVLTPNINYNKTSEAPRLKYLDPEYIATLQDNIKYTEERIPGFIPYGSSVGVAEAGLPHAAGDIDGYISVENWNNFLKNNPNVEIIDKGPLVKGVVINRAAGDNGVVDVNLIHADSEGYVTGDRGILLARIFFPKEYSSWAFNGKQGPLKVKVDDVLLAAQEQRVAKTIADGLEINPFDFNKEKHFGRPFVYLSHANPDEVSKGLKLYGKSFGATLSFPASLDDLTDINQNKEILKQLNIPVSIEEVAADPKKMKNVLDLWYYNLTIRGRGVRRYWNGKTLTDLEMINAMVNPWQKGVNTGGVANGAGRNTVTLGNSGHAVGSEDIYGFVLIRPPLQISGNVLDRINLVKRTVGAADYNFTGDDIVLMQNIAKKHGLTFNDDLLKTSKSILDNVPADERGEAFLNDLSKEMGVNALTTNVDYGLSGAKYSSVLEPSDPNWVVYYKSDDLVINQVGLLERIDRLRSKIKSNPEAAVLSENTKLKKVSEDVHYNKTRPIPKSLELDMPISFNRSGLKSRHVKQHFIKTGQVETFNLKVEKVKLKLNEFNEIEKTHYKLLANATDANIKADIADGNLYKRLVNLQRKQINVSDNKRTYGLLGAGTLSGIGAVGFTNALHNIISESDANTYELYSTRPTQELLIEYNSYKNQKGRASALKMMGVIKLILNQRGVNIPE